MNQAVSTPLLRIGLALIMIGGALRTPEIARRCRPAAFARHEKRWLDRQGRRLNAALQASPLTEARRRRLQEDILEWERMRQRRESGGL